MLDTYQHERLEKRQETENRNIKLKNFREEDKKCGICKHIKVFGLMFVCSNQDNKFIKPYNICGNFNEKSWR